MATSPVAEHDHPLTRLGGHRMHDILRTSGRNPARTSENEDEELAELASAQGHPESVNFDGP